MVSSMYIQSYSTILSALNLRNSKVKQIQEGPERLVPTGPNPLHNWLVYIHDSRWSQINKLWVNGHEINFLVVSFTAYISKCVQVLHWIFFLKKINYKIYAFGSDGLSGRIFICLLYPLIVLVSMTLVILYVLMNASF